MDNVKSPVDNKAIRNAGPNTKLKVNASNKKKLEGARNM